MPISTALHEEATAALIHYPDKFFDLAFPDPPYGIDAPNMRLGKGGGLFRQEKGYIRGDWDKEPPSKEYFKQLFRVSKNQIIWGANHFISRMPVQDSRCWIVWDKNNGGSDFADCELAWTSFDSPIRMVKFTWSGMLQGFMDDRKEEKIHPTQKPIYLYRWLLHKYAKPGDKILDTHMGSQSSRIAADIEGFDYWGMEVAPHYYADGCARFEQHLRTKRPNFNFPR